MQIPQVNISAYITEEEYQNLIAKESYKDKLELNHITDVFKELETSTFEILKTQSFIDDTRSLVRGAVTRIGAYSNIGKSKLAYWLAKELLKNKYTGAIFTTEVNRHTVLANMISCIDEIDFWQVIKKEHVPSENSRNILSSLQIYDSKHGSLFLKTIREYILANNGILDFIVIDFCQTIKDYQFSRNEYDQMSNYAIEVQQLAQNFNICVIDLSQLANQAVKEDFKESGFIAYKGSGGLYASADIGIQLTRNKTKSPDLMCVEIRKHKFYKTDDIYLKIDFSKGLFSLFNNFEAQKTNYKNYYE